MRSDDKQMESIPDSILSGCDIAFLDIDFEGKRYNGIDIARKLRAVHKDAVIIFVTNYIEYAPEGYWHFQLRKTNLTMNIMHILIRVIR